jgi:hypothetical protein
VSILLFNKVQCKANKKRFIAQFLPPNGAVEKVKYFQIFPLCPFVQNFVILCGSMFWILPQRDTMVITKVHKGLFKHPPNSVTLKDKNKNVN